MKSKLLTILTSFILLLIAPVHAFAADFTVTSVTDGQNFLWNLGSPCDSGNSHVETYPGNNPVSDLFACEPTFGSSANIIPDGDYYIFAVIGGQGFRSQVFSIVNGSFAGDVPTPTPTPTPTPINHAPTAVAGTSLDSNGNIQLDGSLSSDPDNDTLTYIWDIYGQSNTRNGQTVSISDLQSGTYSVTLTINDGSLNAVAITKVGIVNKRPSSTINMSISSIVINKTSGAYTIKGILDSSNLFFNTVLTNPIGRLLFELQTGGTASSPVFGVVGENTLQLSTVGNSFR